MLDLFLQFDIVTADGSNSPEKLPPVRIELTTPGLRDQCSTTELKRLVHVIGMAIFVSFGSKIREE